MMFLFWLLGDWNADNNEVCLNCVGSPNLTKDFFRIQSFKVSRVTGQLGTAPNIVHR